ncbi:MaoC/PaaZ C-terminal domain-containing protein [Micromonospora sp. RTGN7]|uniref:MaoC/PaaZ C-terminal domain-containing protein n=1 Tax=Micromonospora sp. RTGN7 TaxID=3016526 RepID=UPI0039B6F78B
MAAPRTTPRRHGPHYRRRHRRVRPGQRCPGPRRLPDPRRAGRSAGHRHRGLLRHRRRRLRRRPGIRSRPAGPRRTARPRDTLPGASRPGTALPAQWRSHPLHSDPTVAERAGLPRPLLHGLCTYGYAGRALLHTVAGSDPARLRGIDARFTAPVYPGDTLTIRIWRRRYGAAFQAVDGTGRVVLNRGAARVLPRPTGA